MASLRLKMVVACSAVVVTAVVEVVVVVVVDVVVKCGDVVECVGEEMLFCVLCVVGDWIWILTVDGRRDRCCDL